MTAQTSVPTATTALTPAPALTPIASNPGFPSTIEKGRIWKDGQYYVTITAVEEDLVEYGYPHRRDVYYLSAENFRRQFKALPKNHTFTDREKQGMMAELKKCLEEIKAKNLGDHVYVMMDELGL